MSQPTTPRLQTEVNAFVRSVDYAYEHGAVPMTAALIMLYVAPLGTARAYALVPIALTLVPLLLCQLALFFHRRGLLKRAWQWLCNFVNGVFIRVALGLEHMRQSKLGQLALWLALGNLGLGAYWLWHNVDLLHVVRNLVDMAWLMLTSLRDPVALLESFQELLRSLAVYRALEMVRTAYVLRIVTMIEQGSWLVLFDVGVITALLVVLAVVGYVLSAAFPCHKRDADEIELQTVASSGATSDGAQDDPRNNLKQSATPDQSATLSYYVDKETGERRSRLSKSSART